MHEFSSPFKQYKSLKSKLSFFHKGYDVSNIIASDLVALAFKITPFSVKALLKLFFRLDLSPAQHTAVQMSHPYLATIGLYRGRPDYYEIIDNVCEKIGLKSYFDISTCSVRFTLSWANMAKAFKIVFLTKETGLTCKEKLQLWAILTYRLNTISYFDTLDLSSFKKYIAFSSVHPEEAIFNNYFQKRGIKTYSLQHGIYYIYQEPIPVDALSYENFNADYHLCWGKYTKDEFVNYGISEDRLLIAGYPRAVLSAKERTPQAARQCIVFLARSLFDRSNRKLLDILRQFKLAHPEIAFHIKLHPTLDVTEYQKLLDSFAGTLLSNSHTINALLQSGHYGFAIAVNTACYYEAYMLHVPCLRFSDDTFENGVGVTEDTFEDMDSLEKVYKGVHPFIAKEGNVLAIEEKMNYLLGSKTDRYKDIIHS